MLAAQLERFVSIAVITLLGVAVLTGIYAGCRDAFLAAGRFYDQQGLHDLQVLSTYGLTDDDATALRRIDGVQTVQPERSQTVTTLVDGTKKTVTMQEIGTEGLRSAVPATRQTAEQGRRSGGDSAVPER